jgi:predicted nucleotidyltransferase component of viral defense system
MSAILDNAIFSEQQKSFLLALRNSALNEHFYLTGGTALAACYTHHRVSQDLDLFSENAFAVEEIIALLRTVPEVGDIDYQRSFDRRIFLLRFHPGSVLKVEFVLYPFRRCEPGTLLEGLQVDSVRDILVNKLMAMTDRRDAKDYVDFYFGITANSSLDIESLMHDARQKFGLTGIEHILRGRFLEPLPPLGTLNMLVPLDLDAVARYFQVQAKEWIARSLEE